MAQRGIEGPAASLGVAPGQREPAVGDPSPWGVQVDLAVRQAEEDPDVGPKVPEEVDLVVPVPLRPEVGRGRMGLIDHIDGEALGPRVTVEAGPEHGPVLGPGMAGVGGRMHTQDTQVAAAPGAQGGCLLVRAEWRLADGEEGQHPGRPQLLRGQVPYVVDHDGRQV